MFKLSLLISLTVAIFSISGFTSLPSIQTINPPVLLKVYYLTSDDVCIFESQIFNSTQSIIKAVAFAQSVLRKEGSIPFSLTLDPKQIVGCNVQDDNRAVKIYNFLMSSKVKLQILINYFPLLFQADSICATCFCVFLGPPLVGDCGFVDQWMTAGEPNQNQVQKLYHISYTCPVLGFSSVIVDKVEGSKNTTVYDPITGASVVVHRKTFLTGLMVYLLNSGWKRIAMFYEFGANQNDIPEMFDTISVTLNVYRTHQVFEIIKTQSIWPSMNFTELFQPIQNQLDGTFDHAFLICDSSFSCSSFRNTFALNEVSPCDSEFFANTRRTHCNYANKS